MLRTLAINSNKKCVKFWCFDSFLITKANMRLRKVIWNPWQSNGKLRNMKSRSFEVLCHKQIQNTRSMGSCSFHLDWNHNSFHPGRNSIRLPPPLHPVAATLHPATATLHPNAATFHPGCITSGNLLPPPLHLDVLHPEFRSRMGEEGVSTSSDIHIRIL